MTYKKTIAIDFDGVIHKYSKGWQNGDIYDEPNLNAGEVLGHLQKKYNLVIFTARDDLQPVRDWMQLKFPYLNIEVTNQKPKAFIYLDDRAVRFRDWNQALEDIAFYAEDDEWHQMLEGKK